MNFDEIKQILELVREHELTEFELEQDGVKIRIQKPGVTSATGGNSSAAPVVPPSGAVAGDPVPPAAESAAVDAAAEAAASENLAIITSPIVGTLYHSPSPGARAFVDVGDHVQKGQVLCIIEAMKLMNEITSEHEGEIVSVFLENGQPVQYGERLFAIRLV